MNSAVIQPVLTYAGNAITNLTVPFACAIKTLQCGYLMMVDGYSLQKGNRFNISLEHEKPDGKVDIILHLAIRFDEKCVVRNSQISSEWQTPDKSGGLGALKQGGNFECYILIKEECFKIAFNKKHLADYKHRALPNTINKLKIDGAVHINSISFQRCPMVNEETPIRGMPPRHAVLDRSAASGTTGFNQPQKEVENVIVYGPTMPVGAAIPGNMKIGRVIYISGKINKYSKGFQVDFKEGSATGHSNIAFHFRVHRQMKAVWCNSWLSGKWGKEDPRMADMAEYFPFKAGTHFDLVFLCEADGYKISVNNRHLMEFKHRIKDLDTIRGMLISGDVVITHFRIA